MVFIATWPLGPCSVPSLWPEFLPRLIPQIHGLDRNLALRTRLLLLLHADFISFCHFSDQEHPALHIWRASFARNMEYKGQMMTDHQLRTMLGPNFWSTPRCFEVSMAPSLNRRGGVRYLSVILELVHRIKALSSFPL